MRRDNPFGKLEKLLAQMEEEFEANPFSGASHSIDLDLRDTGETYVVTADLPGFEKDAIDVTLADRTLRIEAEQESDVEVEEENYIRQERTHESVSRSVRLPEPIDEEEIEATYSNGVLTITLPKRATEAGTKIDVV